jgi:AcrR family transcriptional regulator
VSPRGVAVPDAREQLFAAAEQVLARDGPQGLTSRAITEEAGVAKGLLYAHFPDLDAFLAELVLDRTGRAAKAAQELVVQAGESAVTDNLVGAVTAWLDTNSHTFTVGALVLFRPGVMAEVHRRSGGLAPSALEDVERGFAAYLAAEQRLGRIAPGTDTRTLALALVGAVHHLFLTRPPDGPDLAGTVAEVVTTVLAGHLTRRTRPPG